jgi:hypothetical protein
MNENLQQICIKCLIPETYPSTTFNQQGVCNHCLEFKKPELLGEEAFLEKIRSKQGDKYDCVLGISGGKDSCYVAYLAKEKFKLRALAVCYDFPFLVDLARQNIQKVCDSLDLDLVIIKCKNNLEYDLLRNHMISLAGTGTTWGQCLFCHYGIDAVLYNVAKEKNIPFILSGITKNELWNPGNRNKFLLNRVKRLPVTELIGFAYHQSKAYWGLIDQRKQFKIPDNSCFNTYKRAKLPSNGPEIMEVFDYIHWDQDDIEKTLKGETGWAKPDKATSWRYDCILESLLDYTYKKEFGISTVGLYLSGLIRNGLISREEALRIQKQSEDDEYLKESVKYVFDFLKIPQKIQNKFFNSQKIYSPQRHRGHGEYNI